MLEELLCRSLGSVIVTEQPGVRLPVGATYFSFLQNAYGQCVVHLPSYSVGARSSYPGSKAARA